MLSEICFLKKHLLMEQMKSSLAHGTTKCLHRCLRLYVSISTPSVTWIKDKYQILPLGKDNHRCGLGDKWLECSSTGRDLGDVVDAELNVSEQCALTAKSAVSILGALGTAELPGEEEWLPYHTQHWCSLTSSMSAFLGFMM